MKYKKSNKKGITLLNIFLLFLLIISLVIFLISLYFLYLNLPGKPQSLEIETQNFDNGSSNTIQFYSNMKFNHNEVSYNINQDCSQEEQSRMVNAFQELSNKVNLIIFKEVLMNPDIKVSCSKEINNLEEKDYFIAGEGGAKEIVQTGKYNVITNGLILLYQSQKNSIKCNFPNTEIHELIHVFGFGHSDNKNSLMYPILESCEQKLDKSIIEELNRLYSEENLPDLYFEEAKATKRGRYLDFNITIKNSGTIDAQNIDLTILDKGEIIETKPIEEIKYGAGIFLETQNLKLINRDSQEIKFIIDYNNKIKEINKTNNKVVFNFGRQV